MSLKRQKFSAQTHWPKENVVVGGEGGVGEGRVLTKITIRNAICCYNIYYKIMLRK